LRLSDSTACKAARGECPVSCHSAFSEGFFDCVTARTEKRSEVRARGHSTTPTHAKPARVGDPGTLRMTTFVTGARFSGWRSPVTFQTTSNPLLPYDCRWSIRTGSPPKVATAKGERMRQALWLLVGAFLCQPSQAQDIRIRVLDGRNGHAVRDEMLNVWLHENAEEGKYVFQKHSLRQLLLPTDKSGEIRLHADSNERFVTFSTDYYLDCRVMKTKKVPSGFPPAISVAEILKSGAATENGCGKFRVVPTGGELVFFVRPWHWWERLLHPP